MPRVKKKKVNGMTVKELNGLELLIKIERKKLIEYSARKQNCHDLKEF